MFSFTVSLLFCGLLFSGSNAKLMKSSLFKGQHNLLSSASKCVSSISLASSLLLFPPSFLEMKVLAVSGGGKDYATKDLREDNFSGRKDLGGKDFTQCDATGVKFMDSVLSGSRFYRANLKDADFSRASLLGTSLEDTDLKGARFTGAVLKDAYLSASITDAGDLHDADFSDAQMPDFSRKTLCLREDVTGTNKLTGVETRESLFCDFFWKDYHNKLEAIKIITHGMSSTSTSSSSSSVAFVAESPRTCQTCKKSFFPSLNSNIACKFHPESYSGETAQRWMDPGDYKGAAVIHHFYSCCGGSYVSTGCCQRKHLTYDDEEDFTQLRPGMSNNKAAHNILETRDNA